ncbi:ABC-2 type transport system ATP-binding protein [Ignavigranum ruoffiae]|uniref:ABC-2 type transport system ATP-binding protein n=1 Tax=Ignavigranum ruoffiae TaxID=89093 RepID=A0A1H9AVT7_9LACT|nr:ABC transporter ATP-binding protein [Ignavigranum ruoffiae]UPQ85207.1 ABC transporter ATP-binding protein [Ignavigranum ruoffiae]SEP80597.1 ABC-2 type transport system ATP-binding protein [Ignavigranum ruoffiae]
MKEIVRLEHLTKSFQQQKVVDIDQLVIQQGEVYGLIGPNGAGKSTIMKIICGLQEATSGAVHLFGQDRQNQDRQALMQRIGALIEEPSYYENLTGPENLEIVSQMKRLPAQVIEEALEIVGLSGQVKKKVKHYSLGMKQRLAIAMAIMGRPPLVILDEPTNGLDPQAKDEIRRLVKSLPDCYQTTVMVSSHALDEIEKMASQIGILAQGELLYQGTIENFKHHQRRSFCIKTSDNELACSLLNLPNQSIQADEIQLPYQEDARVAQMNQQLVQAGIEVYRLYENVRSLEELFIEFTADKSLSGGIQ